MFSRLFLFYIVFISCYFNISLSLETKQNKYLLLQLKLKDYDIKFAEMEKIIAVQDRKLEQQNVRFVEMEKHIAKQDTTIEKQNVRFAEHNRETLRLEILMEREKTKFAEQNRKIEVQKTMITEQNTKLCDLKSQIETLQTSETKVKNQLAAYSQDINNIKMTTENMKIENLSNDTGVIFTGNDNAVIFTRWGRSDCPRSISTQVYNGTTKARNSPGPVLICIEVKDRLDAHSQDINNIKVTTENLKIENSKIIDQLTAYSNLSQDLDKIKVTTETYSNLSQNVENIKVTTENMTNQIKILSSNDNAVIFTRWGRSDCPRSTSTQVYNGTTGGGHYSKQGTSVNYVCMPHEPLYNKNKKFSGRWSSLYGAEYQSDPKSGLYCYGVPCAVCRAAPYSTKLMIPGRNKCYPGWQEAYYGELRSGYNGHKAASEYICLDEQAQHTSKHKSDYGKLLYPVRARCGTLPCPPYEDKTLVTCVICIK